MNFKDEDWIVAEPESKYWSKRDFPFQEETGRIIGIFMEIHRILGKGFLKIVYKEAFEIECIEKHIPYGREKKFEVNYKGRILSCSFNADFVVFENVIVEIKAQSGIADSNHAQIINYLAVSKCPVGLLINFGEDSLIFKRYALTKTNTK